MRDLRIYLAAPLFNERERTFNSWLTDRLEAYALVFLPQRDGSLLPNMIAAGVDLKVAKRRVFEQDRNAIAQSHLLVAILDGAHIDDGVAFELGFAAAIGCKCVALQTEVRRALPTGNNPMVTGSLHGVFDSADSLVDCVETYADHETRNQHSA